MEGNKEVSGNEEEENKPLKSDTKIFVKINQITSLKLFKTKNLTWPCAFLTNWRSLAFRDGEAVWQDHEDLHSQLPLTSRERVYLKFLILIFHYLMLFTSYRYAAGKEGNDRKVSKAMLFLLINQINYFSTNQMYHSQWLSMQPSPNRQPFYYIFVKNGKKENQQILNNTLNSKICEKVFQFQTLFQKFIIFAIWSEISTSTKERNPFACPAKLYLYSNLCMVRVVSNHLTFVIGD